MPAPRPEEEQSTACRYQSAQVIELAEVVTQVRLQMQQGMQGAAAFTEMIRRINFGQLRIGHVAQHILYHRSGRLQTCHNLR